MGSPLNHSSHYSLSGWIVGRIVRRTTLVFGLLWTCACGTNTEQPVFPLYTFTTIGAPTIHSVLPVETYDFDLKAHIEFNVSYFLTNSEDGFQGYNLYISTSQSSAEAAVTGLSVGGLYLPDGRPPTFPHVGADPSTVNAAAITQRINYFKAPPGPEFFEFCEKYYFRLSAVIRSGSESNTSPEVEACAAADPTTCPSGSGCNP